MEIKIDIILSHIAVIRDMKMEILSFFEYNEWAKKSKKKPIFGGKKNRSALLVGHYNEYDLIFKE